MHFLTSIRLHPFCLRASDRYISSLQFSSGMHNSRPRMSCLFEKGISSRPLAKTKMEIVKCAAYKDLVFCRHILQFIRYLQYHQGTKEDPWKKPSVSAKVCRENGRQYEFRRLTIGTKNHEILMKVRSHLQPMTQPFMRWSPCRNPQCIGIRSPGSRAAVRCRWSP